ncbi:MAG: xylulokinase [Eubacterium sp.]|nr:xylulokinase [Eubacterium sp.]
MLYIGVDLGTSAVKLLLMDENGVIQNITSRDYPLYFPKPGWSEQNPEDWLNAVLDGLQELTEDCDKTQIAGIGAGGQMHGLVVLDADDKVIRPTILWNDGRTQKETDWLNNEIGTKQLSSWTGNIAFAGFTAPKLLWMRENEPALFAKIDKVMLPKDYINYMLSGVHCTDYSDASGMLLLDVAHKCWSREMLEICGITEAQMPKLFESYDAVGTLKADIAERLGFPENVVIAAGAGDNAAAAVGTDTVAEGSCNISLGTSGTIFIPSAEFKSDDANALHAFAHSNGQFHLMGCMLSAASCNKWWLETVLDTDQYAEEQAPITDEMLGKNHVFFLPYLMGERAPHNDPSARGCFIGLTMDSTRADMTQAVLEGISFGLRDSLEAARAMGIEIRSSMLCGGGAKSPLWKKMLANIMNIELTIPETEQGPGYGGAMLAGVACGKYATVEEAAHSLVRVTETVKPDPELAALYEERYQQFRKMYPALKGVFKGLS